MRDNITTIVAGTVPTLDTQLKMKNVTKMWCVLVKALPKNWCLFILISPLSSFSHKLKWPLIILLRKTIS